jgi:ATP-dependent RNA helicase DDX54/DBP10
MLSQKRKRAGEVDDDHYSEVSASFEQAHSDDEIDISSALAGKKAKLRQNAEESDDGFNEFLQESISKRDIKGGTEVVKKAKGKGKIVKGELGGGSFQSMGE